MRGLDSRDERRDAGMEDDLMVTIIGLDSRDGRRDAGMEDDLMDMFFASQLASSGVRRDEGRRYFRVWSR